MAKSVLKPSIVEYEIGPDLPQDKYSELLIRLGDWFAQTRNTKEPVALAKHVVDACLKGLKPSDLTPWDSAATATLAKRIRMAARFDIETMKPLETASEAERKRKERRKELKKKRKDAQAEDKHYPDEYKLPSVNEATYGDDPLQFFTTKERENYERKREELLKKFPQLDNVVSEGKVSMLLTLHILFERLQFRALAQSTQKRDVKVIEDEMSELTKRIVEMEKAMGIDPVTLAKTQKDKEGGSIGEAVRRFESMGDYKEIRLKYWAEELLMIYTMFMQPSPRNDMGGYQLDEVGLYGLTKTRVVECPHCGQKNWGSLKIEEIEEWLLENGYLKPAPDTAQVV